MIPLNYISNFVENNDVKKLEIINLVKYQICDKLMENDKYSKYSIIGKIEGFLTINSSPTKKELEKVNIQKHIRDETPQEYTDNIKPYVADYDKKWIYNILDHIQEKDAVIYEDEYVIFIPDLKQISSIEKHKYLLAIVKNRKLNSIRDLSATDILLLEHIYKKGNELMYGTCSEFGIRSFIHYRPSVWHLHIHFTSASCPTSNHSIDYSHQLSYVIQNIKMDSDYYKKVTLKYVE